MVERAWNGSQPTVIQGLCSGCGSCAELCPQVFAMDPDSEAAYVCGFSAEDCAGIQEAMVCCPEDCIDWTD